MKLSDVFLKAFKLKMTTKRKSCCCPIIRRASGIAYGWSDHSPALFLFADLYQPEGVSMDFPWWDAPDYFSMEPDPDFNPRCFALLLAREIALDLEREERKAKKRRIKK